jgi:integrase
MPRVALTDRFVASAKAKDAPQVDYFDEHTVGLALRVSEAGKRSWTLHFTSPKDHKRARMTLGSYPSTSLAAARTRALQAKEELDQGIDPRDALAAQDAGAMTVSALYESWRDKHVATLRSGEHIGRRMKRNALPVIGSVRLADLHRRDINRVVDPILKRGKAIEANRVFENMRAMLRWAVARGDLDHSPMDGMSKPSAEVARDRVLSDDEIRIIWTALPDTIAKSATVQRIAKLCFVTGQRVGEVSGMRSDELDLKKRIWSLPGSRTKNANPHLVPLSDLAIGIIKEALAAAGESEFVFPSEDESIRPRHVARTLLRAQKATKEKPKGRFGIPEWTPHDLRRTVLTNMAALGVQPIVIGAVANHLSVTKASVTFASYVRHDYGREKAEALNMWAERLSAIVKGNTAEVVPMRTGRRR